MSQENPDWWRGGAIYQIYPRSFSDSRQRGWGDLNGIRRRLPYLASLGVDVVWVCPFFKSPMEDFGYDVEDHRRVDPMFGTDEEFDLLIAEAQSMNIKIMVDLVLSHVAKSHRWFQDASKNPDSEYSDCFVWADAKPDGSPPNNWLSIFGGSAWAWNSVRCQYYLHNFLVSQPDLNFHDPRVRAEALSIARFWLERGVSGFRLDTVNFYFHDRELRDNPATDHRDEALTKDSNPYGFQDHIYDKNRPEVLSFLSELGALMREYPGTVTLGEIGSIRKRSWSLIRDYTDGDRLSLCYTFDLLGGTFSAPYIRDTLRRSLREAPNAWPCWAYANHDVERSATRLAPDGVAPDTIARLSNSLLLSLRGTPCIYQGEELGLEEVSVPFEQLQDPYGIEFWPDYVGRDGCRTPMPWEHAKPGCGFTSDAEPWLPIPEAHRQRAVSVQEEDPDSPLNHFRRVVAMRRREPALQIGDMSVLDGSDQLLSYVRSHEGVSVCCYFNLSGESVSLTHLGLEAAVIFDGRLDDWRQEAGPLTIEPWSWVWVRSAQ